MNIYGVLFTVLLTLAFFCLECGHATLSFLLIIAGAVCMVAALQQDEERAKQTAEQAYINGVRDFSQRLHTKTHPVAYDGDTPIFGIADYDIDLTESEMVGVDNGGKTNVFKDDY